MSKLKKELLNALADRDGFLGRFGKVRTKSDRLSAFSSAVAAMSGVQDIVESLAVDSQDRILGSFTDYDPFEEINAFIGDLNQRLGKIAYIPVDDYGQYTLDPSEVRTARTVTYGQLLFDLSLGIDDVSCLIDDYDGLVESMQRYKALDDFRKDVVTKSTFLTKANAESVKLNVEIDRVVAKIRSSEQLYSRMKADANPRGLKKEVDFDVDKAVADIERERKREIAELENRLSITHSQLGVCQRKIDEYRSFLDNVSQKLSTILSRNYNPPDETILANKLLSSSNIGNLHSADNVFDTETLFVPSTRKIPIWAYAAAGVVIAIGAGLYSHLSEPHSVDNDTDSPSLSTFGSVDSPIGFGLEARTFTPEQRRKIGNDIDYMPKYRFTMTNYDHVVFSLTDRLKTYLADNFDHDTVRFYIIEDKDPAPFLYDGFVFKRFLSNFKSYGPNEKVRIDASCFDDDKNVYFILLARDGLELNFYYGQTTRDYFISMRKKLHEARSKARSKKP